MTVISTHTPYSLNFIIDLHYLRLVVNYIMRKIFLVSMSEKVVIQYRIVGIDEFPEGIGFVAVYLEPTTKLDIKRKGGMPKIHMLGMGKDVPVQVQNMMQMVATDISMEIEDRMPHRRMDPRDIIHVEPMVDFVPRGWKFGDIVSITIEKTKDVNERDPAEFEAKMQ